MSTVAVLPSTLREKLTAMARRVRLLRAVRGFSVLTLTLALVAAAALTADAWLDLPVFVRRVLLACWCGLGVGLALFGILVPLCRRIDASALAALIEERHPELGERLTSSVELSGDVRGVNGAPALIALLIDETEKRTGPLDFVQAVPARHAGRAACAAVLLLLLAAVAAIVIPGRFTELCGRFLFPWQERSAVAVYTLTVTPGDAVVARGRPLTLTAVLTPTAEGVKLPGSANLIMTDAGGSLTRLPMLTDDTAFSLRLESVVGDFAYRIESGGATSDSYHITAVEPINVAAGSPTLTVTPPEYAKQTFKNETLSGFHDLAILQHSRVRLDFRFTQPAREASLQWPTDKKDDGAHVLTLATDQLSASVELPALMDGSYKLALRGENGFDTELAGGSLNVKVDQPPSVARFTGGNLPGAQKAEWKLQNDATGKDFSPIKSEDAMKSVLPYEAVPIEAALTDDVGVEAAELEYRINDGPAQHEEITLQGRGMMQASGRHLFQLGGKVKDGDTVRYRLRIADNRDVPEAGLKPHVVYFPADKWFTLKISGAAEPLAQQEIQAQREDANQRLDAIKKELEREQRAVYKLRQETKAQPSLLPEQTMELKALRKDTDTSREALEQLARDLGETPQQQPLADKAREVADEEMRHTEADLAQAEKQEQSIPRNRKLQEADKELSSALRKLDDLRRANERVSQERLDQARLEAAARRQEDLARRAAELAAKDPIKDASTKPQTEQLQRDQKALADELDKAANQSEPLRKALDQARAEQARQLGDQARELAKQERELAKKETRDPRMEELARKQAELAGKAAKLAQDTRQPTQAAQTTPLKSEAASNAALALKQNDASEALQYQNQSANELHRVARELDKASEQARDPKEAARQLARLQKGLQDRLKEELRKKDDKTPLAKRLDAMQPEQKAIAKAAEELSVPPRNDPAQRERQAAVEQAEKAAESFRKHDPRRAADKMEQSRQALERLADRLPSLPQREQETAAELDRLRRKQEEIGRQSGEAAKEKPGPETQRKLDELANRQADVAEQLGKLDTPLNEARRDDARNAAAQAEKDLKDAKAPTVAASQRQAQRELERLQQAMASKNSAGKPCPSCSGMPSKEQADQARDLASQQRELEKAVRRLADEAARSDQQPQQKLQEQTGKLAQELEQLAQQMNRSPREQEATRKASAAGRQAQNAMNQAEGQSRQGNQGQSQQMKEQAAQSLDRAARELAHALGEQKGEGQPAGQAVKDAQENMKQAQGQLSQGQRQSARSSMQKAAQALQQAAQQLAQQASPPTQGGQPNQIGAAAGGKPEQEADAANALKMAGKRWGDLPGELQTKIIQDLKAKYGDDYARIIKQYFEEIAATGQPTRPSTK
jgi:hypothetical protein